MSISSLSSGLSGMRANQTALDASSHNIANAETNGFTPQQVSFKENAGAGVQVNISQAGANASATTSTSTAASQASATDLNNEIVNSLTYQANFAINAKVVKTADQTLGTLLDIKA